MTEKNQLLIDAVYKASNEGMFVIDDTQILVTCNQKLKELWSIDDQIIGLDFAHVLTIMKERVKDGAALLEKMNGASDVPVFEIELLCGKTLECYSSILESQESIHREKVWFFRDITDHKLLERSHNLAQITIDWAQDAIFRMNWDARFLYVNDAACRHLGYTKEELLKLTVPDINPSFSTVVWRDNWNSILATGWRRFETQQKRKDGSIVPVEVVANCIELEGEAVFFSFVRDITDRKLAEEKLLQAKNELESRVELRTNELRGALDKAEQAGRAKNQFLSSMSHELRTPMNAILGFSQLMMFDKKLTEQNKDNLKEILMAGNHLMALINDVLDLSKIDSGHIDLSLEPVDIHATIIECINLLLPQAEKNRITLSYKGLEGISIRADRTRFKQAMINLLSNAIKYNNTSGSVKIEAHPAGQDRIRIMIIDTGQGIPANRMNELFQPFNRLGVENGTIEGTGIGLSITRRIVEMMDGSVDVKSDVGIGSTFWIEMPLASLQNFSR